MKVDMDASVSGLLKQLSAEAVELGRSEVEREAAKMTGGLPVHYDMGGVLLVTPDGQVLHYDPERRLSTQVGDPRWRLAALVKAARRAPGLRALAPDRPGDAVTCVQCEGKGRVMDVADCGVCMGLGWMSA